MRLQVNRVAQPVTVLGPGRRLGLWVQGCRIHCAGCASVDTWSPVGGYGVDTDELATELAASMIEHRLTGLTITGGEPTEQAEPLAVLVIRLRELLASAAQPHDGVDVLLFSGRTARAAARLAPALWAQVDVAVCGPYTVSRPGAEPLLATANQRLVMLSPLGRRRFADLASDAKDTLQAKVRDGEITLIGMPRPGDLDRLESALVARGVRMEGRSWQRP